VLVTLAPELKVAQLHIPATTKAATATIENNFFMFQICFLVNKYNVNFKDLP
jgi:hypothetical protein